MAEAAERAREYYRALDDSDYDALAALLAPDFVQARPDLTLDGRDRFVRFMREERPQSDTTHVVEAVFEHAGESGDNDGSGGRGGSGGSGGDVGNGGSGRSGGSDGRHGGSAVSPGGDARHAGDGRAGDVAVRGRLLRRDGSLLTKYVDVFTDGDDGFERLDTYTR